MASHQGDHALDHPMVKKFGSVDGAQKNTVNPATTDGTHTTTDLGPTMADAATGTTFGKSKP